MKKRFEGVASAIGVGALFFMCLISWEGAICLGMTCVLHSDSHTLQRSICTIHPCIILRRIRRNEYIYTSSLDPVSTALDLIRSLDGEIRNEGDDLQEGREVIVFYDASPPILLQIRTVKPELRCVSQES